MTLTSPSPSAAHFSSMTPRSPTTTHVRRVGREHPLGRGVDPVDVERRDEFRVARPIVVGQAEAHERRDVARDRTRRLPAARQRQRCCCSCSSRPPPAWRGRPPTYSSISLLDLEHRRRPSCPLARARSRGTAAAPGCRRSPCRRRTTTPLSSRRFMFMRDVNAPPRMSFIASTAMSSRGLFARHEVPCDDHRSARIRAGRPGRRAASRATRRRVVSSPARRRGANRANNASSFGWISASVVSPTTIIVALFGLNQVSW